MRLTPREQQRGSRVRDADIGERWPEIPEWVDLADLDTEVRRDLRGLAKDTAAFVGAHLLAAGTLAEEDPEQAWLHARAARSKGGRIAVVRETVGLVAYRAGQWTEAISELRAARRMGGGVGHLAVMADCERALGHPEKAIEVARAVQIGELDAAGAAELRIVVAGARADLGQLDAALVHLEAAGLETEPIHPYSARLYYAYADLLLQSGRRDEAVTWFMKAAEVDLEDETDAAERLTELADPDRLAQWEADRAAAEPSEDDDSDDSDDDSDDEDDDSDDDDSDDSDDEDDDDEDDDSDDDDEDDDSDDEDDDSYDEDDDEDDDSDEGDDDSDDSDDEDSDDAFGPRFSDGDR